MNWYSLRVMSGRENKVKDTIFRELGFEKDLKGNVEEILIPTENIVDIKNGKKTVKEKSLLPGYILVKMLMNNEKAKENDMKLFIKSKFSELNELKMDMFIKTKHFNKYDKQAGVKFKLVKIKILLLIVSKSY